MRVDQFFGVAVIGGSGSGVIQVGIEDKPWVDNTVGNNHDAGAAVHGANGSDDTFGFGSINQIGLSNKDKVSKLDLVH